jgi:hypothetical protein
MANRRKRFIHSGITVLLLCCGMLLQTCGPPRIVAIIRTRKSSSRWKNKVKVFIRFSSRSLLENRMAVINASDATVAVYPVDVTLEIPKANITLPAVVNFDDYVSRRASEAKKQCAVTKRPKRCSRYVTRYFNHYSGVKTFSFGEIPPKGKRNGYFAFNLPDPFNQSSESKRVKKRIKNKGRLLKGTIRVMVRTVTIDPQELVFTFAVKVMVSKNEKTKTLRIMKYF